MSKSTPRSLVPIPDEVRTKAKELFLAHTPINDISKQLKISTAAIARWRSDEDWVAERDAADEALMGDIVSARKVDLAHIAKAGIEQIKRTVKFIQDDPDPMSIASAEKMANLIATLDKVHRLDSKQATENVAMHLEVKNKLSVERVVEIIKSDPFFVHPEVEPTKE